MCGVEVIWERVNARFGLLGETNMNAHNYEKASDEQLAQEARLWTDGTLRPDDWADEPDAVPRSGATTPISIRLPTRMLSILKALAEREGIGYQVLIKRWLDDRIKLEKSRLSQSSESDSRQPAATSEAAGTR